MHLALKVLGALLPFLEGGNWAEELVGALEDGDGIAFAVLVVLVADDGYDEGLGVVDELCLDVREPWQDYRGYPECPEDAEQCYEFRPEVFEREILSPGGEECCQGCQVEGLAVFDWLSCLVMDEGMVEVVDEWIECGFDAQRLVEYVDGCHYHVDGSGWPTGSSGSQLEEVGDGASGIVVHWGESNFLVPAVVLELD